MDFDYFVHLFEEYYLSDDTAALGNFINGKLDFEDVDTDEEDADPGLLDHHDHHGSSTSVHSMDDDLEQNRLNRAKPGSNKKKASSVFKAECCITS